MFARFCKSPFLEYISAVRVGVRVGWFLFCHKDLDVTVTERSSMPECTMTSCNCGEQRAELHQAFALTDAMPGRSPTGPEVL